MPQLIARHFLDERKRAFAGSLVSRETKTPRASRDVIPIGVRRIADAFRERQGLTWQAVARGTGLAHRTVCAPGAAKRGYRRWVIARLGRYFHSPELERLSRSDIYWDRIKAIEPEGIRQTYDLQIEGERNFLANDLVVHNSHAASFALLAYASAYMKTHYPAAFYAALLNNQPMGFYHPATIVRDAQRHGQVIHPIDVNRSDWLCTIEADGTVRLGLRYAEGLREETGRRLEAERRAQTFASVADLVLRAAPNREELARLAEIGALASLGLDRRHALWESARAIRPRGALYAALPDPPSSSPLAPMTAGERVVADYEGTSLSLGPHPMSFHRARLVRLGAVCSTDLAGLAPGARVRVAGAVVVRQRPGTAKGLLFMNLEDETGLINIVVYPDLFRRERETLVGKPFLLVEGVLQRENNVTSVLARRVRAFHHGLAGVPSHDFH